MARHVWLRKTITPEFAKRWLSFYNLEFQKGGHKAACIFAGVACEEVAQKGLSIIRKLPPYPWASKLLNAQQRGKRRFLKCKNRDNYLALAERVLVVVKELKLKRNIDYTVN